MNKRPKPIPATWYCVHDLAMRQLYLGTDEAEARRIAADNDTILRSGRTRGAAMKAAALLPACDALKAHALRATIPTGPGERHAKIFELIRILKTSPELAERPAAEFEALFRQWFEVALPSITTKSWSASWSAST